MESRLPAEYQLEITADRSAAKDVIQGRYSGSLADPADLLAILHTIFFHRVFTAIYPSTHEVLDTTLPYVSDDEVESTIDQRTSSFLRQLEAESTSPQSKRGHGQLVVQFSEKKRRKSGWFVSKADEETIWEIWTIDITLTGARSEPEAARNKRLMEKSLETAAMRILSIVNGEKSHIPPITTNESNPFPYQILINPKGDYFGQKGGIF